MRTLELEEAQHSCLCNYLSLLPMLEQESLSQIEALALLSLSTSSCTSTCTFELVAFRKKKLLANLQFELGKPKTS